MIKIMSFNVNGIRSLKAYVTKFYNVSFNDYIKNILKADILCLQEVRGNNKALEEFHVLSDYVTFTNVNKVKSGQCGVSTIISKKLYCKGKIQNIPYTNEGRVILTDHGNFKLLNIYFPYYDETLNGNKDHIMDFYNSISCILDKYDDLVVCGDFNAVYEIVDHYQFYTEFIRIKKEEENDGQNNSLDNENIIQYKSLRTLKKHPSKTELPYKFYSIKDLQNYLFEVEQRKWMKDLIDSQKYIDVFRLFHNKPCLYTCWNTFLNLRPQNLGTRIDYVLVSKKFRELVCNSNILPNIYGSDHCPVYVDINLEVMNDDKNVLKKKAIIFLIFLKKTENLTLNKNLNLNSL